jgi:hypothetical protein
MPSANHVARLRDLYQTDELASFFDWASEFKNDVSQTTVSRIQAQIGNGLGERPKAALDFCKKLEALGCGRLVLGRHGKKSRMEWAYTLRSIGAVARGDTAELDPRDTDTEDEESEHPAIIRLEIPLRGNQKASIELPEDISENDVKRLLDWIGRHFLKS